jgi:hypothetical protein
MDGKMDGSDPSILTKPCHLALSKPGTWQISTKKTLDKKVVRIIKPLEHYYITSLLE